MDEAIVREMTEEDIRDVCIIERACFAIPWTEEAFQLEIRQNKLARYVVVEVQGMIVGHGGMWKIIDEAHITNIAVHPDYRGRGYGNLIVEKLIKIAKKEKVFRMTLEVRKSNTLAQNLYQKYGFKSCGIRPKYYQDNNEDAVIMWRE
jgi:ribosomal-protein-alanine N-acetyltransferase